MKFKVGDKVEINDGYSDGCIGEITDTDGNDVTYYVEFIDEEGDSKEDWFCEEDLEAIKSIPETKRRGPKSWTVVIWEEDEDPAKLFEYFEEAQEFVKVLLKRDRVKKDSIKVARLKGKPLSVEIDFKLVEQK